MKNTPSALKWLGEKRGRLAHALAQTKLIAVDVNRRVETLEMDLAALVLSLPRNPKRPRNRIFRGNGGSEGISGPLSLRTVHGSVCALHQFV